MEAASIIEGREDELAALMAREAGKPMKEARMEVGRAAAIFRYYGSEGWRLEGINPPSARPGVTHASMREPLGVVGLITPWNFPLAIPSWKMAPALICGNTIVIKPAANASLSAAALVGILSEAGLPDGVVNMVTGPGSTVGDALVTDPRVKGLSFTGSTATGLGIQGRAIGKKVQLEMGGKNPFVVMEDADLADAAAKISFSAFGFAGEKCTAASRAIVVEAVYDEFIEELKDRHGAMKVGDPMDEDVAVGPVVNKAQYDSILEALETAKAREGSSRRRGDGFRGRGLLYRAGHRGGRGQSQRDGAGGDLRPRARGDKGPRLRPRRRDGQRHPLRPHRRHSHEVPALRPRVYGPLGDGPREREPADGGA
jgi:aldehyde dehydrogenase (NAD+)